MAWSPFVLRSYGRSVCVSWNELSLFIASSSHRDGDSRPDVQRTGPSPGRCLGPEGRAAARRATAVHLGHGAAGSGSASLRLTPRALTAAGGLPLARSRHLSSVPCLR